jgi:hypothetical protein
MLTLLPLGDNFPTFRNAGNYSTGESASCRGIPLSSAVDVTCVSEPKGNISSSPKINVDITCQITGARIAQSVYRLATSWTVRGSNPGGGEIFRTCPDRPWSPPSLLYNGYRVFPGGKERRGVTLTPHPLLVPWSWKSRAIPLFPLWAVRPVQSLSACTGCTLPLPYFILYFS